MGAMRMFATEDFPASLAAPGFRHGVCRLASQNVKLPDVLGVD